MGIFTDPGVDTAELIQTKHGESPAWFSFVALIDTNDENHGYQFVMINKTDC